MNHHAMLVSMQREPQPEAPEWLQLHWLMQNLMRAEKQNGKRDPIPMRDGSVKSKATREKNSLSYEIHLQRSYLYYARKELPYEEVREIEKRYRELKTLYWKLFGCLV